MRELIDREKLLKNMGDRPKVSGSGLYALGAVNQYDCDRLAIETAPTVNAVPVRHGRWIKWFETIVDFMGEAHEPHYRCSECGRGYDPYNANRMNYCPNCGAKMDGKDGEQKEVEIE